MKLKTIAFCLLLLGGLVSSCSIREDLSECVKYSNNKLVLSYKGDGTTEIFGDKICRVEMYVFDAENTCVSSSILSKEQVGNRTADLPQLDPGTYRIICLGNTHQTRVDNLTAADYARIRFAAGSYLDGQTTSGNDSLYYASLSYTVTDEDQTRTIEFASSHYDLVVEVAGIPDPDTEGGALPTLAICGVSPYTDFENHAGGEATDYTLETKYDRNQRLLSVRTNIMRHTNHADVNVRLYNTAGGTLAEVNLAEFLAAHPVIDCTKNEVLIAIRIEFTSVGVEIKLPSWYVENVKPEF